MIFSVLLNLQSENDGTVLAYFKVFKVIVLS